jgi:sRNA-binding carbon storage regulator CsrA
MLVVSRRADETIEIKLADGADGTLTLNDLFAKGSIEITLLGGNGRRVKMGIEAPPELSIRRVDKPESASPTFPTTRATRRRARALGGAT